MGGTSQQSLLFRHALIQDAAYQSLLTRKRVHFHHAIADAIVESHPDIVATQPELVARHYTEGRRDDLALPYWMKAGERALERSANYEATDHFSNALALAERLPDGPERSVKRLPRGFGSPRRSPKSGGSKPPQRTTLPLPSKRERRTTPKASCESRSVTTPRSSFSACRLDQSVALLTEAEAKIAARRRQATLPDSVAARARAPASRRRREEREFRQTGNRTGATTG